MKLDINFDKLMEKIRSLFKFGSDVTFRLSYVNEEKRNVLLLRDDNLEQIRRQGLNPVIITVKLINPVVFKVNYGNVRHIFDMPVKDMKYMKLDLNFDKLMEKIRNLFNFGSDVTFRLSYVNEYKHNVLLLRDDDLEQIRHQGLNPVIINVKLINPVVFQVNCGNERHSFDMPVKCMKYMKIDLNFDKLMEKIRSLFNFSSDVTFRLSYVDEYKRNVLLLRDDNLEEIRLQGLNPVIITVKLTN